MNYPPEKGSYFGFFELFYHGTYLSFVHQELSSGHENLKDIEEAVDEERTYLGKFSLFSRILDLGL